MSDRINAWNFIDVNRLETVMTGLLDQSGSSDLWQPTGMCYCGLTQGDPT